MRAHGTTRVTGFGCMSIWYSSSRSIPRMSAVGASQLRAAQTCSLHEGLGADTHGRGRPAAVRTTMPLCAPTLRLCIQPGEVLPALPSLDHCSVT